MYCELRKCPIVLNSFQYFVNLVVAELWSTVSAFLGMDFLLVYGAKIDLETDQVHLNASTMINTLLEGGVDRIPVRSRETHTLLAWHLNRCPTQVADVELEGVYLFEPIPAPCLDKSANLKRSW